MVEEVTEFSDITEGELWAEALDIIIDKPIQKDEVTSNMVAEKFDILPRRALIVLQRLEKQEMLIGRKAPHNGTQRWIFKPAPHTTWKEIAKALKEG